MRGWPAGSSASELWRPTAPDVDVGVDRVDRVDRRHPPPTVQPDRVLEIAVRRIVVADVRRARGVQGERTLGAHVSPGAAIRRLDQPRAGAAVPLPVGRLQIAAPWHRSS